MIGHKAPRHYIAVWQNIFFHFSEKVQIILPVEKYFLAVIALIAALWNAVYNTFFDWIEGRLTGRPADHRPYGMRILHALGFEGGLSVITLPIVMLWTGMGWLEALIADVGLAIAYTIYAFFFNIGYDRVFPID